MGVRLDQAQDLANAVDVTRISRVVVDMQDYLSAAGDRDMSITEVPAQQPRLLF
jgi:hypothetical protein